MSNFIDLYDFIEMNDKDKILEYLRNVSVEDFINDLDKTCEDSYSDGYNDGVLGKFFE